MFCLFLVVKIMYFINTKKNFKQKYDVYKYLPTYKKLARWQTPKPTSLLN